MKKILPIMIVFLLLLSLTACGSSASRETSPSGTASTTAQPPSSSSSESASGSENESVETSASASSEVESSQSSTQAESSEAAPPASSSQTEWKEESSKILIAYFSRTGNTERIAKIVQQQVGGDLFKIETETPYSDDYNTVLDDASKEQRENARPALSSSVDNMDDYNVIFVGYPIWWGDTPMAVLTFLESYDLAGKTVIPFCTYDSSGSGSSFKSVKSSASGATVLDGFSIAGSKVGNAAEKIAQWLESLNITEP